MFFTFYSFVLYFMRDALSIQSKAEIRFFNVFNNLALFSTVFRLFDTNVDEASPG